MFTIVSMYTNHSIYVDGAKKLAESCERFGLTSSIYPIEDTGSWEKNCQQKPMIIKKELSASKSPVVWIDSDAVLNASPDLFTELSKTCEIDIAYYYFKRTKEYLSGTLYFAYNDKVMEFLNEWENENDKNNKWDQINMRTVLQRSRLAEYRLPDTYCKIFDNKHQCSENTVITHYQASRVMKRLYRTQR